MGRQQRREAIQPRRGYPKPAPALAVPQRTAEAAATERLLKGSELDHF